MSDFPSTLIAPTKPVIASIGGSALIGDLLTYTSQVVTTAVWPAANRAIYMPVLVEEEMPPALAMAFQVVVQSGNLDVGIYDEKGNRIVTKGSTAVGAAGIQTVDLTTAVTGTASPVLTPGTYFLAMCVDNVTASFIRTSPAALAAEACGVQQQAVGAVTLPNPATFANPASAYVPTLSVSFATTL